MGLGDIVERALARDPGQRYRSAAAFAADLRRHLADLPLRGVGNRNPLERFRKWRRRRPAARVVLALSLTGLTAVGLLTYDFWQRDAQAHEALRDGRYYLKRGQYFAAEAALKRGSAQAEHLLFRPGLAEDLHQELRLAEQAELTEQLHFFVEQVRPLYGADGLPRDQARDLGVRCQSMWERRHRIAEHLADQPATGLGDRVRTDMLDLAILRSELLVRFRRTDRQEANLHTALAILDEAEALFGPSCVLDRERRQYATALGETLPDKGAPAPRTNWEHYALGRAYLRANDLAAAEGHLRQALDPPPSNLWPYYYHGQCAYQRGRYQVAVADFTACVAMAPGSAWCFYNRALAHTRCGEVDEALEDYGRALQLDARFASAALNRAMLYYERKDYQKALDDLQVAGTNGANPADVAYDRALVLLAQGSRAEAITQLREALKHSPSHKDAKALLESLH
jgi:tetratricopeptide (TPR) repeat protein